MKIYFYDKWKETPDNFTSPVQSKGNPVYYVDTSKYIIRTIIARMAKHKPDIHDKNAQFFVRLVGKDYQNELIGNWKECIDFALTCLSDAGIYKEKLGRKKINVKT